MLRICSQLVLSALLLLAVPTGAALAADLRGPIRVIDGDTLDVGGARVRLHGIDAPEADQTCGGAGVPVWHCGAWVSQEVRARYQGQHATCAVVERDRYGRYVATCTVAGADIGRALVSDGLAFAFRRYSMAYDLDEKAAVVAGRGLHAVDVAQPSEFRATKRAVPVQAVPESSCPIKGNVSRDGKRIFHLPGQAFYDKTRIDVSKGERWFCSAAEARAAGWRAARR